MPYEITYDADAGCMMCRMFGVVDMPLVRAFGAELIPLVNEHHCSRVLNDLREADLALSLSDIYTIPKLFTQIGFKRSTKRALVANKMLGKFSFFETISLNRWQSVRVFSDPAKAKTWLLQES